MIEAGPETASEAVVFVHGNPGSCDDWERLAGAVGALGVRAVALDLPDFGETIAPEGFVHDVPTYASFVIRGSVVAVLALPPTASKRSLLKRTTPTPEARAESVGFSIDLSV